MSVNNITGNNLNPAQKAQSASKPKVTTSSSPTAVADTSKSAKTKSVSPTPEKDNITLTDSAVNLRRLEDDISKLPIVDTKKVEDVQKAIKDGSYTINPDNIASKLIDMEVALSR